VKALVCFSVAIGSADPEHEIVETVFESHYDKMEILLGLFLHLSVPSLTKMFSKLEEKDLEEIADLYQRISPHLEKAIEGLVKLRMKAMYVDLVEGKISTPESITQGEAEGIFILAFLWNRQWGEAINTYQAASQEEKMRRIEFGKKITAQVMENIEKLEQSGEKDEELRA
jgi:AbiV family abortive infection protein